MALLEVGNFLDGSWFDRGGLDRACCGGLQLRLVEETAIRVDTSILRNQAIART
jgi:hypothetical protein